MRRLCSVLASIVLLANAVPVAAQEEEWFVGSHPDFHGAMIREMDGVFVAVYVTTEEPTMASPLVMETVAPACGTKRPIAMHSSEAIMALGPTAEERLEDVRSSVEGFIDRQISSCPVADDFSERFFHRFDDAYRALDALLVETGILPLDLDIEFGPDDSAADQEESSE